MVEMALEHAREEQHRGARRGAQGGDGLATCWSCCAATARRSRSSTPARSTNSRASASGRAQALPAAARSATCSTRSSAGPTTTCAASTRRSSSCCGGRSRPRAGCRPARPGRGRPAAARTSRAASPDKRRYAGSSADHVAAGAPPDQNVAMPIPTFREVQDEITAMLPPAGLPGGDPGRSRLRSRTSRRASGEPHSAACASRWTRCCSSMRENFRQDDFVTRDEREGDRFLLFLSGPRRGETPFRSATLRKLVGARGGVPEPARRPPDAAVPQGAAGAGRAATASCCGARSRARSARSCGSSTTRAACALMRVRLRERDQRERLLEIIQNREIWTAFQPIVEIETAACVAWEGLSRGPRGSDVELPMVLFGQAARYGDDRGARARLPPPGVRRLAVLRRAGSASSSTPCPPPSATRASSAAASSSTSARTSRRASSPSRSPSGR